jgi:phytanoyl-CoA hydroxylase
MYILKEAEYGAEVSPHQDSTFLWSDAPSCTGFWIALDDATLENGCLWAIPGSHKGEVRTRFVLSEDGQDLSFQPNIGNTWDVWPKSSFTPLPVVSGTLVLIHGALVHMSLENASKNARHIYSWHVVSADQKFSDRNWMGTGPFAPL